MGDIFVKFKGGFGNQLFQYALCLEMVRRFNVSCTAIHLDRPGNSKFLNSSRESFQVIRKFGSNCPSIKFKSLKVNNLVDRIKLKYEITQRIDSSRMKLLEYHDPFTNLFIEDIGNLIMRREAVFIDGYFQNPVALSFGFHETVAKLHDLTWDSKYDYLGVPRTTLHIRRGDYLTTSLRNNLGVLSDKYYESILKDLKEWNSGVAIVCEEPSEILVLTQKNPMCRVIGDSQATWLESFVYLARSKELFVSNSTFSFWAGSVAMLSNGAAYFPKPWGLGGSKLVPLDHKARYIRSKFMGRLKSLEV